jgi:hypothetical protein
MPGCRRSDTGIVASDELQEACAADVVWRGLRAQMVAIYICAGTAIALSGRAAAPYVVAALVLLAATGTVYLTRRIRAILAPHRDRATGELPFRRPRLRLMDVIAFGSTVRNR